MNINDIAITSLEEIAAFEIGTGAYLFSVDEMQSATIANSEEKQDVTGKQGRKLTSLKKNKSVVISGTNGLVSGGLMEMQIGSKFKNETTEVMWTDYLTVDNNSATISYAAVGTEGAEISAVYIKTGGTLGTKLTQSAAAKEGVNFAYNTADKKLTFVGLEDKTEIVVYYMRNIQANVLENLSDSYSGKCSLYINALGEDTCNNVYRIQIYIPRADFSGEFSLEMGGDQVVHSFEAEALAGCGTSILWTYTVFDSAAADAQA